MKKILLPMMMLISMNSFANEKGNGGTVLDCGEKVVLADFEEVKLRAGLRGKIEIAESSVYFQEQIHAVIRKVRDINSTVSEDLEKTVATFIAEVSEIEGNYEWTITPDIGPFPVPRGCKLKNTVMYIDNGPVELNSDLFNKLSETHKAGIIIHEAVYKLMRDRGVEGSAVPARRLTAMLFAQNPDMEILKSLVTRYLAPRVGDLAFFLQAPVSVKEYYQLSPYWVVTTSKYSEKNSYKTVGLDYRGLKISGHDAAAGDFYYSRFNASGVRGEKVKFEVTHNRNDDPKENRLREQYQTELNVQSRSVALDKAGYALGHVFLGFVSPRMNTYLEGKL